MQGPSEPSLGRALLLTLAAMAFWFAAIWLGVLAMFWYLIPLGVVCVIYVTAMFHLIELSAVPRLLLTLAAPAPASGSRRVQRMTLCASGSPEATPCG